MKQVMKKTGFKKCVNRVLSFVLTIIMAISLLPGSTVILQAAGEKNESNTKLGTGDISNPEETLIDHPETAGHWDYVYFGRYNNKPLKFRMLDKHSTAFGGDTMLLDCDQMLKIMNFDDDSNSWADSEIKTYLNGSFLANSFLPEERSAIAESIKSKRSDSAGDGLDGYLNFTPLTGEKVFLLDANEAINRKYGFMSNVDVRDYCRIKCMFDWHRADGWWLRSSSMKYDNEVGVVENGSGMTGGMPYNDSYYDWAVSPVINLSLSPILFSTKIKDREYKLTLKVDTISANVSGVARNENEVTVPYRVSKDINRVSVLITDKDYNDSGVEIKYYRPLNIVEGSTAESGYGVFTLPDTYDSSSDKVYIVAERTSETEKYTDYASEPVLITIPSRVNSTVNFNANEGTGTMEAQNVPGGVFTALNANSFTRDGFIFTGWNTAADGSGIYYQDQGRIRVTDPVTLYAQWAGNSFETLQALIDKIPDGATLTLGTDFLAVSGDTGLYIAPGRSVIIDLNGHSIDRGLSTKEAENDGYLIKNEGSLRIKDSKGGGILTGGNVEGCGGGILNTGTLTLEGGKITGNTASLYGGGIYNDGDFILTEGSSADITGNYLSSSADSNVYLPSGRTITVYGIPSDSAKIGLSTEDVPAVSGPIEITNDYDSMNESYFISDNDDLMIAKREGESVKLAVKCKVTFHSNDESNASYSQDIPAGFETDLSGKNYARDGYIFKEWNSEEDGDGLSFEDGDSIMITEDTELYAQWSEAGSFGDLKSLKNSIPDGGTLKLEQDYAAKSDEGFRTDIKIDKNITIDLNGHTMDKAQRGGNAIYIEEGCTLTLTDTSENRNGKITGASNSGIINYGELIMLGGCITENSSEYDGGGVQNSSSFIMRGGSITKNHAGRDGGGVCVIKGIFKMTGGSITDNSAGGSGGGVYLVGSNSTSTIDSGDSPIIIKGNTVNKRDNNLYNHSHTDKYLINVDNTPVSGSEIGITIDNVYRYRTFTKSYAGTDASFFFSDDKGYTVVKKDGEGAKLEPISIITFDGNGGNGAMNQQKLFLNTYTSLSKNNFIFDGYDFTGWNTKADGSGTSYGDEEEVSLNGNTTLYAQWLKIPKAMSGIVYDGQPKELVSAGAVTGGTIQYALVFNSTAEPDENAYSTSIPKGTDAGTYNVWFRIKRDYSFYGNETGVIKNITIEKTDRGKAEISGSAKYGHTGCIDLSSLIEEDGKIDTDSITVTEGQSLLSGTPSVNNEKLYFTFKDDIGNVGKTAAVSIPVKDAKNYTDYFVTAQLTVSDKDEPVLTASDISVEYNGEAVSENLIKGSATLNGLDIPGSWTFKKDTARTNVSDSGKKTVIFTPDDTREYKSAETSIMLTILRKNVTVRVDDKKKAFGENDPAFTATVTGVIGTDKILYTLSRKEGEEEGTYTITPSGEKEQGNYKVVFIDGTLTITKGSNPSQKEEEENKEEQKNPGDRENKDEQKDPGDQENKEEQKNTEEQKKKPDRVPFTESGQSYASANDNFTPIAEKGSINSLVLDFSNVSASGVDPLGLKITAISGSRFTTKGKLKDRKSIKASGGVKVSVNKKTLIPVIKCRKDGSVTLTTENDATYTVFFTVQKPKAQKAAKSLRKDSGMAVRTIKDLFGTDIDAGELTVSKQKHSQASISGNSLYIDPKENDSIKVLYKYLNRIYKIKIKVY